MDFFCVRAKPRYHRRRHNTREYPRSSSVIHIEARLRRSRRDTHRASGVMGHLNTGTVFSGCGREHCSCSHSCSHSPFLDSPTRNATRDHEIDFDPGYYGMPARNNPPPQIRQIYVHPYSTYHYRFPVVVHSANGHRLTASPIFYTAIVPESATVRDIEAELINRQGQVGMARLMATENLVCMNTFQCIRTLHDAALQLEVWDVADVALIP